MSKMTSVLDDNVCNVAVDGDFDACQAIVKTLFADPSARDGLHLAAINSVNWARILAQVHTSKRTACNEGSFLRLSTISMHTSVGWMAVSSWVPR
jgi:threonine synthase